MPLLTDTEFDAWATKVGLSDPAREAIDRIRHSPPSRNPESRRSNVTGRYASLKMECTLGFESHTGELPYMILADHDPDVQEFYDQPDSFSISYETNNKKHGHLITPDFFMIRQSEAYWVEIKYKKDLEKISAKSPGRYCLLEDGWHCPPAERHAASLGLGFKVVCPDDYPHTLIRNCKFLRDYYISEAPVSDEIASKIKEALKTSAGVTVEELREMDPLFTADAIFALIIKGHIFCDLRHHFLGDTNTALLFPDALVGQACLFRLESTSKPERSDQFDLAIGNKLQLYQNSIFDILERKDSFIILRTPDGKTIEMDEQNLVDLWKRGQACSISHVSETNGIDDPFNGASKKALEEANTRYYLIEGEQTDTQRKVPVSTLNRWKASARLSEKKYGNRHSGLIPQHSRKGNRTPRYSDFISALCNTAIKEHYSTADAPLRQTAYGQFCLVCQEKGITPPSIKWFFKQIKMRPKNELEKDRRGSRAGYAATLFVYNLNGTTPPQGDHPWDICHIDHTQLDLENIDELYGTNLGRPWLTLLTSAYSRKVLAYSLSLDPPSTISCMLVLSDCVKKHNRLPSTVVVDWGREFESVAFEVLLARNHITKKVRPPHEARNGAVLERFFGVTNEQLIHNLKGNTKIMKNPRLATKSVSPTGRAVWTLPATHELLGDFFEQFHKTPHSALSTTPNHFHQVNIDRLGPRGHRYIKYDETFRRSTMVHSDRPRVVHPSGVRINHGDYWCSAFTNPAVQGSKVEVCYSAHDIRTALALVNGVWETCTCVHYDFLEPLSEKALELATQEILKKRKLTASCKKISALELAAFIKSAKSKEVDLQMRKDRALAAAIDVQAFNNSLGASPVEPPIALPANEKPEPVNNHDDDPVKPCGSETNE